MSDGSTHLMANVALSALAFAGLTTLRTQVPISDDQLLAMMGGFILGSVFITPDLDLKGTRTMVLRAWGPLWIIWLPVLAFSKHRGRSHTYLRGPLFRIGYLLVLVLALTFASASWLGAGTTRRVLHLLLNYGPLTLPGYLLTQWLHLRMDHIPLTKRRL